MSESKYREMARKLREQEARDDARKVKAVIAKIKKQDKQASKNKKLKKSGRFVIPKLKFGRAPPLI
jgi:hypothetical protein